MLRLQLSQGSGAAGVIWANAVTSRCDSGAPDSTLRYARFDDRKAAVAVARHGALDSRYRLPCRHSSLVRRIRRHHR